jgi:putative membrane protein
VDVDSPDRENEDRGSREPAVRDHLANERTLLAWQRTALAVVGIGFLVDRFALGPSGPTVVGSILGTVLILLGAGVAVIGAYQFLRTEREIERQTYRPAIGVHLLLTGGIVVGAVALALFVVFTPD